MAYFVAPHEAVLRDLTVRYPRCEGLAERVADEVNNRLASLGEAYYRRDTTQVQTRFDVGHFAIWLFTRESEQGQRAFWRSIKRDITELTGPMSRLCGPAVEADHRWA